MSVAGIPSEYFSRSFFPSSIFHLKGRLSPAGSLCSAVGTVWQGSSDGDTERFYLTADQPLEQTRSHKNKAALSLTVFAIQTTSQASYTCFFKKEIHLRKHRRHSFSLTALTAVCCFSLFLLLLKKGFMLKQTLLS